MSGKDFAIVCGKHLRKLWIIEHSSVSVVEKVRKMRSILHDTQACRVCSQVLALHREFKRKGWRTCLLCGAQFDNATQRLNHEKNHPLPIPDQPLRACEHGPLSIRVTHRAASVVEQGTNTSPVRNRWRLWSLPAVMLRIIEEENRGSVLRNGWYYPRTRESATALDKVWHRAIMNG